MTVYIREGKFSELFDAKNFDDLAMMYTLESGNPAFGRENVDTNWYLEQERDGVAKLIIAEADDHIVGFCVLCEGYHPHFSVPLVCIDVLYLTPAYRRGLAGLKLIRAAKRIARDNGFRFLQASAPAGSRLNKLYARIGQLTDNEYLIPLGDSNAH